MASIISNSLNGKIAIKPKQYLTASDVDKNGPFKAALNASKKLAIDRCENFMTNVATSAFAKSKKGILDYTSYLGGIVGGIKKPFNTINAASDMTVSTFNIIKGMAVGAIEMSVAKIANIAGTYTGMVAKLPIDMTTYIAERTAYWTTYNIKKDCNIDAVIKELSLNAEIQKGLDTIERKKEKIAKIAKKVSTVTGNIKKKIEDVNESISAVVESITSYIQEGPDWVQKNVLENLNTYIGICDKYMSIQYKSVEDYCKKKADTAAQDLGAEAAEKIKRLIIKNTRKKKIEIYNTTTTAMNAAHSAKVSMQMCTVFRRG